MSKIFILGISPIDSRKVGELVADCFDIDIRKIVIADYADKLRGYRDIIIVQTAAHASLRSLNFNQSQLSEQLAYMKSHGDIRLWLIEDDFRRRAALRNQP